MSGRNPIQVDTYGEEPVVTSQNQYPRNVSLSKLLCACGVTLCAIIIIITMATSNPDHHPAFWNIMAITSIISTIVTIVIWNRLRLRGINSIAYIVSDVAIKPKILFLWIFGFARILSSALQLATSFHCIQQSATQLFPGEFVLSTLTSFSDIAFVISQLSFLSSYSTCKLKKDTIVNFGLSTIILTHIVQWFRALFSTLSKNDLINNSMAKDTNHTSCLNSNDFKSLMESISPYTEPMSTEYSLLAVGIVLRLLPSSNDGDVSPASIDKHTIHLWSESQNDQEENTSLLPVLGPYNSRAVQRYNSCQCDSSLRENITISAQLQVPSFYRCLLAAFLTCLPILIALILNASYESDIQLSVGVIQFFFKGELTVLVSLNFYLWYTQFKRQNVYSDTYDGKIILLLSTSGMLLYSTFGLIAGSVHVVDDRGLSYIATFLILQKLLEMFVVVCQTSLIIKAQNLHVHNLNPEPKYISADKMFYMFFLIRVIMWIADSYIGKNTRKIMPIETEVYGDKYWKTINDMLYPVTMFYLFHTSIDFYQLYKKYEGLYM